MKQFLKKALLVGTMFLGAALFAAGKTYVDCYDRVYKWINNQGYAEPAKKIAMGDLEKIHGENISDDEKINRLKEKFPGAFPAEEILFRSPILFEVEIKGIAREVNTNETVKTEEVTLYEDIKKAEKTIRELKQRSEKKETNKGGGVKGEIVSEAKVSTPPLAQHLTAKANINAMGHYSTNKNSVNTSETGWGKSKQEIFNAQRKAIKEKLKTAVYSNPHFSITITLVNKSGKVLTCDFSKTQIPIKGLSEYARPHLKDGEKKLTLNPGCELPIFFRAKLNTDLALNMADVLAKQDLDLRPNTYMNIVVNDPQARPVDLNLGMTGITQAYLRIPGKVVKWDVRQKHSDSEDRVKLSEVLEAIHKDYKAACGLDLFDWQKGKPVPVKLCDIPIAPPFADFDKDERFVVFLQVGSKVYQGIPEKELTESLWVPVTLWVVDLAKPDDYLEAPEELREAIFKTMKTLAAKPEAKAIHQFRLALMYINGIFGRKVGVKDKKEAVSLLRKAASQGHMEARYNLGWCYNYGFGISKNYNEAFKCYTESQDLKEAQFALGECYKNGWGTTKNLIKAAEWYRKAANQGMKEAQFALGECYKNGWGVTKNLIEAAEWYRKAADQGMKEAQFAMGECYKNGWGMPKNLIKAVKWYRKSAEEHYYVPAQFAMGECYNNGWGVQRDLPEAKKWYKEAADRGMKEAQFAMGECYNNGWGVTRDPSEAREWYLKAAKNNYAPAQFALGEYEYYKNEENVTSETLQWYRKAANQGYAPAQFALGMCYELGEGVKQDLNAAVDWYEKAANQGLKEAQFTLGKCYENGKGKPKDFDAAVRWWRKAAAQGYSPAKDALVDSGWFKKLDHEGDKYYGEKKYSEAVKYFRLAAEAGYGPSQYSLGKCYENGEGVKQNLKQAAKWYHKAAIQGNVPAIDAQSRLRKEWDRNGDRRYDNGDYNDAVKWYSDAAKFFDYAVAQHSLGRCYELGHGAKKDIDEAVYWYQKAKDQGYVPAINELDRLFKKWDHTGDKYYEEKKYAEAVKFYRKAAEHGYAPSQYSLGRCYELGLGVEAISDEADKWYSEAATQGNFPAQSKLTEQGKTWPPSYLVSEYKKRLEAEINAELARSNHPLRKRVERAHGGVTVRNVYVSDLEVATKDGSDKVGRGRKNIRRVELKITMVWDGTVPKNGRTEVTMVWVNIDGKLQPTSARITKSDAKINIEDPRFWIKVGLGLTLI